MFDKFILIDTEYNSSWINSNNLCLSYFNTTLGSIHSKEDYNRALELVTSKSGGYSAAAAWIGLTGDVEQGWVDGTSLDLDFANITTNKSCVSLKGEIGSLLDDENCVIHVTNVAEYALCNAPSELCDQSYWNIITGSVSSWTGCDLKIDEEEIDDVMLVMNGKQWVNIDESLKIHYMINIENITNISTGGDMEY